MSNAGDGVLFKGLSFFVGQRVPTRSTYIDLIRRNGGELRPLEKSADIQIADHVRRSQNAPETVSYEWIDKSIKEAQLLNQKDFPAGPLEHTPRPLGAGNLRPAKTTRSAYTEQDDAYLIAEVAAAGRRGMSLKGNDIYKQIEAKNPRHPWQSWRDRWIKYLSSRNPVPAAGPNPRTQEPTESTMGPTPTENRTVALKKTTTSSTSRLPATIPPQPSSDPDFSIVIPQYTTPVQQSKTKTSATTTTAGIRPGFTEEEDQQLLDVAEDIENVSVRKYDRAWIKFGKSYPQHTTEEWKQRYETKIRPIYRQSAPDSGEEEEDGESEEAQVAPMLDAGDESTPTRPAGTKPVSSPFVEVMMKKNDSPANGKRKRDSPPSSPLSRSTGKSSAKIPRNGQTQDQKMAVEYEAPPFEIISKVHDNQIHLAIMSSEAEEEEDEEAQDQNMQDDLLNEDDQPPTQVFPNDSQPWEGLSPEKNSSFRIHGSQDEFSEEGEENAMLDADDISPGPRRPVPGALQVFGDNPQDFLLSRGLQEESQEFYDASQGIDSSMDIVPKIAAIPTPDLFKRKATSEFDIEESEEEEDSRSSFERDGEEIAAQLARESAYQLEEGNLPDQDENEGELEDDEDYDDAANITRENESLEVEDEETPRQTRAMLPIPDSDAILPPDDSAAEEEAASSPSPRKTSSKRPAPSHDQETSDLEDYTEMPSPQDSDIENVDVDMVDADDAIPSMERYADTQAVLQADTQALDADFAPPEIESQTLSQWAQEQKSQELNSDIAPSSPAPRAVNTSSSKRVPAHATARSQPRTNSALFFSDNDGDSEDGFEPVPPQATLPTPKPSRSPTQRVIHDDESYEPSADDKDDGDDSLPQLDDALKMVAQKAKAAAARPVVLSDDAPLPQIDDPEDYAPPQVPQPPQARRFIQVRQQKAPPQFRQNTLPQPRPTPPQPRQFPAQARQPSRQAIPIPIPSSTSTSFTDPDTLEEEFIQTQVRNGHKEPLIIYGLQRTAPDVPLALQVIVAIEKDKVFPTGVRGIWSHEDDRILIEVAAGRKLSNTMAKKRDALVGLHGLQRYDERIRFVKDMMADEV